MLNAFSKLKAANSVMLVVLKQLFCFAQDSIFLYIWGLRKIDSLLDDSRRP